MEYYTLWTDVPVINNDRKNREGPGRTTSLVLLFLLPDGSVPGPRAALRSGKAAPGYTDYITTLWPHNGNPHNGSFTARTGRLTLPVTTQERSDWTQTEEVKLLFHSYRPLIPPPPLLPLPINRYFLCLCLSASINTLFRRRGRGRGFHFRCLGLWAHISCLPHKHKAEWPKTQINKVDWMLEWFVLV